MTVLIANKELCKRLLRASEEEPSNERLKLKAMRTYISLPMPVRAEINEELFSEKFDPMECAHNMLCQWCDLEVDAPREEVKEVECQCPCHLIA